MNDPIGGVILDLLKTVFIAAATFIAFRGFQKDISWRRAQVLSNLNERLERNGKADIWISSPQTKWEDLTDEVRRAYQGYIVTFEDLGLARIASLISEEDFLRSYSGRYRDLYLSGNIQEYAKAKKWWQVHFRNFKLLDQDIGEPWVGRDMPSGPP
jgi:hypothetical protein